MSSSISVRIPDCKLGTVRVDRTVDIYPTPLTNNEIICNAKSYVPQLVLQRQLTTLPKEIALEDSTDEGNFIPRTKWNHPDDDDGGDDDDESDIAVIYSIVRCASTRRASIPGLSALPLLSTNVNIPQPYTAKSYTLEQPLTPIVTHISKQAQIKTLTSTHMTTMTPTSSSSSPPSTPPPPPASSQLTLPNRSIQTSTSFTSHDRPSIPSIAIKPRPYSFRSTGRNAIERQISHITERVTQLHDTFFSRLSHPPNQPRNRSLSTFHSTITNFNINDSNILNNRLIRPRPKSETYEDHHRVNTAGSYAQLTLLGQSKANPTFQTQKSVSNESQNDRVQFRTQTSTPERSNNTIHSHSTPNVLDAKKARDIYDKVFKQFEMAKKELDRQRSKGLNHNPARISQLESQLRQYEHQLNDIKRRLEFIEPINDPTPNKNDEHSINRSNTFIEPSTTNRANTLPHGISGHKKQNSLPESAVFQVMTGGSSSTNVNSPLHHIKRKFQSGKTEAYDLVKNSESLMNISGEDSYKPREPNEIDDDIVHINSSNVQSISSFDDIQQLINTSNWIPLTIFLNFLLTDTHSDPSHLLFYILTEELRTRKAENRSELIRWIFEIHSTFTMNGSPLFIGLPQPQIEAINRWLNVHQQDTNEDVKLIFHQAKDYAKSVIVDREIPDFNHKRTPTHNDLISKQNHFIEETLRPIFEYHYKSSSTDDWNSIKNARSLALLCSLATYLKRCDIKKCGNIPLEKIPKFLDREQKRLLAKLQRTTPIKKIKDHQLNEHQFSSETLCQVCYKPLWGINYQGYLCGYCQQAYHRECALNSEKCSKDRAKLRKVSNNRNASRSYSFDNLTQNFYIISNPSTPQQRGFMRRTMGGSSTLFNGIMMDLNGPSRTRSLIEGREGSVPNDTNENTPGSTEGIDPEGNISAVEQNKYPTVGRCSSDRRAAPDRPTAPKNRSSSNPQMGGNTIDEILSHRADSDIINHQDLTNQTTNPSDLLTQQAADGDSDLEADVNTLPNLSEFIPSDVLQILYQTREWKFQTTINELIHTQRTHLKSLKIMQKCFREPMLRSSGMSPVELDCIFRNLDQLIHLHTQFKYALFQHREEAKDHVVRNIGDLILKFLDGDNGEEFARACAYFIEDQSQAIKLIKKKEQSPDFAALMRTCEANPLCRRLTLKDYLPSVMTRFTKYKMLFEAMKKFVSEDPIESEKLTKCIDCSDYILKRMNEARLKKEQEALLKQIKSNLDIQIPNDQKLQNLQDCLEVTNHRLLYSGTLKLLPDLTSQKTEFECCLFTDIFVFFQKIPIQPSEQRGIEESYKYILKEHQRDANSGRNQRLRASGNATKYTAAQNFILSPIISLEFLLIKKKACGGTRSFYVIDTDKKQLIEVEANSKDDLEKWLEMIEKARRPFEKGKQITTSLDEKHTNSSSSPSSSTIRSTIIEEESTSQLIEANEKESAESILNSIIPIDKELKRLLHEKQMLLSRLLNIPQESSISPLHSIKPNSALEAITYASSYYNQMMKIISQTHSEINKSIDAQSISTLLIQLGEQLTLALKLLSQNTKNTDNENTLVRRNSTSFTVTPTMNGGQPQIYSDLSLSSQSLGSVINQFPPQSSITDLDEAVKSPPIEQLHVERYDEGVFDDGVESQTEEEENNSVVIADSDDEDEVEHFDSNDSITTNVDNNQQQQQFNENYLADTKNNQNGEKNSSNTSIDNQTLDLCRL
ncbi:unnamed protein product [Adineta steineri]|uniref:Uncharacterized protein n=1 Tax=Adineta steineri TaxID=433720 RepID=A0A815BDF9_9BILA|nr:unnamed protein product [Adineta steineri]